MKAIHLLIKPASGNCNLRCKYCFYTDITENREKKSYGMMTIDTLETIVSKALSQAKNECTFAFQGGEPTLTGLEFYISLMKFEKKYNVNRVNIHNAIQTNGILLNEEWAKFLTANNFLVGLSLDGIKDTNDLCRIHPDNTGTFRTVSNTIQILNGHKVDFNILTVVTAQVAKNIGKIYGYYKRNHLQYQQYIPCLDPLGEERGLHEHSLTPKQYEYFLKTLFDLWYNDVSRGEFAYNRYFENLLGMLQGYPPESCGMMGHCSKQLVIEADGSVYPCDFYVLDQYYIGNLQTDSFEQIEQNRQKIAFIEDSLQIDEGCVLCKWKNLCRGGCRRDREPWIQERLSRNYYCQSYYALFEYAVPRLHTIRNRRK